MHADETATHRNVTKWIVALALFFALFAFLAAIQIFQVTSRETSERTLRRSLAVVSEIDVLLDRNYEDLQQRAESAGPNETLELRDFPVSVPLTSEEVRTQPRETIRQTLLERGAGTLYDDGTGAMRDESSSGDVAVFSLGGSVDRSLNLLRDDIHLAAGVLMAVLGVISLLLAALLIAATRGFGRVVAAGAVLLASSTALLLLALLMWVSAETDDSDDYVRSEFLDIAREISWLAVRNGFILVAIASIITLTAAVAARVTDRMRDRPTGA